MRYQHLRLDVWDEFKRATCVHRDVCREFGAVQIKQNYEEIRKVDLEGAIDLGQP